MDVFVTGGTGTIGSPTVAELLDHGHTVLALARSQDAERALRRAGARTLRGGLGDLDVLREGVVRTDGVIQLAFGPTTGGAAAFETALAEETAAVAVMAEELIGTHRPIVVASGTPWVPGREALETDPLATDGPVGARGRSVTDLLSLAPRGVRSTAVRIPRTAHRDGRGGFAGVLVEHARRSGVAGYPGEGTQRWPAAHALDVATVFRLALEEAGGGTSWHAVAESGVTVREIATVIGRRLGLPVRRVPEEDFGPLGPIFGLDQPASSAHTREVLGWRPVHPGLLEDLDNLEP